MDARSLTRLGECDPTLVRLFSAVAADIPIMIICGHRGQADQDKAYAEKKSRLPWPKSEHNSLPSRAVDAAPAPLDWNDVGRFERFAVVVKEKASELGIAIVWGGDWRMRDLVHWQLATRRRTVNMPVNIAVPR